MTGSPEFWRTCQNTQKSRKGRIAWRRGQTVNFSSKLVSSTRGAGRTLNRGGIFSHCIIVYHSQHRWLNANGPIRRKLPFDSLASQREKAQIRPTFTVFEQYEPWTEPQLNLRCAEIPASLKRGLTANNKD
jgi:hypothetical protein